jgi:hypothetical protein
MSKNMELYLGIILVVIGVSFVGDATGWLEKVAFVFGILIGMVSINKGLGIE